MRRSYELLLRRPWVALLAVLVVLATLFVLGQPDFVASDPLWYASIAHQIDTSPGSVFTAGDHHPFVMRIGLTVPLSLLYKLFGVSTLVSNLPTIIAALGIVCIVYAAAPTPRAKLLALFFCATCIPLLQHGSVLNVDLPSAALMGLCVLCLSRRSRVHGRWWLIGAAVAWLAAFLVKETALWCAPIWLYVITFDVRDVGWRSAARLYAGAIVVGAILGTAYLVLCDVVWGSPLARFSGVQALTSDHAWALTGKPASAWIARMTWGVPLMLAKMFHVLLVPFVLSLWVVRGRDRVWLVAACTFLLLYWFGSASTQTYLPLPISGRMVLPVLPPLLVLATLASDSLLDRMSAPRWRRLIAVAIAIAIAAPAARIMFGMAVRRRPETIAFAHVRAAAARGTPLIVVCGEPRCVAIANFHFEFSVPTHISIVYAADFAATPPGSSQVWALVNTARAVGARTTGQDSTPILDGLGLPSIYRHRHIRLYDAGTGAQLRAALSGSAHPIQ